MYMEIVLPDNEPVAEIQLLAVSNKVSNRACRRRSVDFQPCNHEPRLDGTMEKVGQQISPLDIVTSGNRHMHALSGPMTYKDQRGNFSIESVDAPVVALGERSPLHFSNEQPDLAKGLHFSLYNNAWGTNFHQWFRRRYAFRFRLAYVTVLFGPIKTARGLSGSFLFTFSFPASPAASNASRTISTNAKGRQRRAAMRPFWWLCGCAIRLSGFDRLVSPASLWPRF